MLDYAQYTCPICHKPFSGEDDIVVCPQCGAPHHRDCWNRTGACAHAAGHGTAKQWKPQPSRDDDEARICGNCGTANPPEAVHCTKCGHVLEEALPPGPAEQQPPIDAGVFYAEFSPYIGIAPDSELDGIPAMDIATYLGPRSGYYLSRFFFMHVQKTKMSWNWAAGLFPLCWLLYRRMYKAFAVVLLITLVLYLPSMALMVRLMQAAGGDAQLLWQAMTGKVLSQLPVSAGLILASNLTASVTFVLRAIMASVGNHLYRRHAFAAIRRIRQAGGEPLYIRYALSKKGGVSPLSVGIFLGAAALCAVGGSILCLILWG